jgi:hypothetical protein
MTEASTRRFEFLPLSIRLETLGGVATPLVLRGTPLPAKRSETFSTAADKQISVAVELCMGESPLFKNNIQLGKFHLEGIPAANRGQPQINVEFSVDKTCSVRARASLQGANLSAEQAFHPPQGLSDEFIAKALADAESSRATDEAELLQAEATNRAKNLVAKAEERLGSGPDAKLSEAVAALGLALASGDSSSIREKSDALEGFVSKASLFGPGSVGFDFADIFGSLTTPLPAKTRTSSSTRKTAPSEQRLTSQPHSQVLGKIFGGIRFTLDPLLCFILMPFDSQFQPLYDDHIKPTVTRSGLRCERADDIRGTTLITWDIWERINRARFLIADLTDQNSNVFYELGLAHALSKDVVLITQSMDFVPFDLKTIRCIVYDFTPRGIQKFEKTLAETITALTKSA